MKHWLKKLSAALLACTLALATANVLPDSLWNSAVYAQTLPATNRDDAPAEVKNAVSLMIAAFGNADAEGVNQYLEQIRTLSPNEWYPIYQKVIDQWYWFENDMTENLGVMPDGLSDPAHHCIIVLGFALNDDGTMTPELVGRLETALASLEKYPESRVLVTGGVEKNGWTEGVRMHDWLIEHGIDESRIYVENKAPDTAGNATYSFDILYNSDVKTVSLISSAYHLRRGSILYYTESLLKAKELGREPIEFLGTMNAGWYREDKTSEPLSTKANSMYSICRVPKLEMPNLDGTVLTGLDIIFPEGNTVVQGSLPNWNIKTLDTKFENLTVTEFVTYTGFDPAKIGEQTVTVYFTYKDTTVSATCTINVVYPEFKEALAAAVDETTALEKENYSPASWRPVAAALKSANAVLANPEADAAAADAALASLNGAKEGLVAAAGMYRLYNPNSGEHFYTCDKEERDDLIGYGWKFEGSDWTAPLTSDTPVYRLYNKNAGDHHYTIDSDEKDFLISEGWTDEGIGWYSEDEDGVALYRQYNPNAKSGAHNYTPSRHENDVLVSLGWRAEGIAWYGMQ